MSEILSATFDAVNEFITIPNHDCHNSKSLFRFAAIQGCNSISEIQTADEWRGCGNNHMTPRS